MKIRLEVLDAAYILGKQEIDELRTKELVPKMIQRRRLTRAAKIAIYLADKVGFKSGKIVHGSSFGEIPATASILKSIKDGVSISPTSFQNSVYNTAISYLSMLTANRSEIVTISSGEKTSNQVLKTGAIKALSGGTLLLLGIETLNIPHIEEVNLCGCTLECGVALKVKLSPDSPTLLYDMHKKSENIPESMLAMINIAKNFNSEKNIIEIEI
jgi:hypothetical protein